MFVIPVYLEQISPNWAKMTSITYKRGINRKYGYNTISGARRAHVMILQGVTILQAAAMILQGATAHLFLHGGMGGAKLGGGPGGGGRSPKPLLTYVELGEGPVGGPAALLLLGHVLVEGAGHLVRRPGVQGELQIPNTEIWNFRNTEILDSSGQ